MKKALTVLFTFAIIIAPLVAFAAVEITSQALVEVETVDEKGEKVVVREKATRVIPGTDVVFVNAYLNKGQEAADNVVIVNPIPEHMDYVEGSALGEETAITFSINGGQQFDAPQNLTVTEPDGTSRPAKAEEYTHIRWQRTSPLPPGQTGEVEFRARLR